MWLRTGLCFCFVWPLTVPNADAQQVRATTPLTNVSNGFFERVGIGLGYHSDHFWFNWPGANSALPPFGGYDPGADATLGFRSRGFSFQMAASQGSNRVLSGQSAGVTVINGGRGSIFSGSQRPFVIGVVPVVGGGGSAGVGGLPGPFAAPGGGRPISPVSQAIQRMQAGDVPPPRKNPDQRAHNKSVGPHSADTKLVGKLSESRTSSAGRGDLSVAEIRSRQAELDQSEQEEVLELVRRGRVAEKAEKPKLATIYYQMAMRRATGRIKRQLRERIQSLSPSN